MGKIAHKSGAHTVKRMAALFLVSMLLLTGLPVKVLATNERTEVAGTVYEFDKGSHYEFHENKDELTEVEESYGTFFVSGNILNTAQKGGVPAYEVADGDLLFFYNYSDTKLNADEDSWHLVDDKSKKIADLTLDAEIMKGAIIIQTSKDRKTWVDVSSITNAFSDMPVRTSSIYTTTDVQLINGCYYRVIIAYELRIRTEDSQFLFVNTDKHENRKYAEIYEFYAYTDDGESANNLQNPRKLGERVRVSDFDNYSGEKPIDKDDPHKDWDLGVFNVAGYTEDTTDSEGNVVFLKNVGDKVTLWFTLNENINGLRGNENLTITADTDGYDEYFEKGPMDFGRGVLFIRYTDRNGNKDTTTYTNFLEANATPGADTKVRLFEEGDYEVALDYEITSDELIDKIGHYRIFFKFSVRNGNCMVYPFDVATGSELTNSSMTENGFRLDLAKSRYLKVNIKREVMKDSADGLVEDTRFNGPAKDGAVYDKEGIYTITVNNEYTKQSTVKKIYVGSNNILRAHMTTGLSIPEINDLVAQGATISDEGDIQLVIAPPSTEQPSESKEPEISQEESKVSEVDTSVPPEEEENVPAVVDKPNNRMPVISVAGAVLAGCAAVALVAAKKRSIRKETVMKN